MSKYIVDIPDGVEWGVVTCRTEDGFYTRDFDSLEELNSDYINEHFGDLQDEAYQRGLDDAWEAARKIFGYEIDGGIPLNEIGKVFGYAEDAIFCTADIIRHNTAQEAIEKLKAYEEKQKADDEIKVGDEVISLRKNGEVIEDMPPWIVTYETKYSYQGLDACGLLHNNPKDRARKTGRHFDIQKILEEMKE